MADVVRRQVEVGLDVVTDGEMSKPSFITYVTERLSGFERSREPGTVPWAGSKEATAFPEFYEPTLRQSPNAAAPRFVCAGPVTYVGQARVQADANTKQRQDGALPHDHSQNLGALSAQGQAQSNFLCPVGRGKTHHTIHARCGQHDRQNRED